MILIYFELFWTFYSFDFIWLYKSNILLFDLFIIDYSDYPPRLRVHQLIHINIRKATILSIEY